MFERFTDRAHRVVTLSQKEAWLLNHNYIGPEHILLGLIREGVGIAAKSLESSGLSLEGARRLVKEIIGLGEYKPIGWISLDPRADKALQLASREALDLGHDYIGPEHILLGLLREIRNDGENRDVAAQVLVKAGVDHEKL